jgi:hypothetical protein
MSSSSEDIRSTLDCGITNLSIDIYKGNNFSALLESYRQASLYQHSKEQVTWPEFDIDLIREAIDQQRLWTLTLDDELACHWTITWNDPEIWGPKDQNDAIYLHRITTFPAFRGQYLFRHVVNWAKQHALQHQKRYIRLDTLGNNTGLIRHYTRSGFCFLGMVRLEDTTTLPLHYQREPDCCLFEIDLHSS